MSTAHGFGQRLQALRVHRGFSQDVLAHKLGLAPGTIARWECELESPKRSQLLMLSDCLRVAVDEIVGMPGSLDRASNTHNTHAVRSLGLHRFLGTSAGKCAQRTNLDHALRDLPEELTAEQYGQITSFLVAALEPKQGSR